MPEQEAQHLYRKIPGFSLGRLQHEKVLPYMNGTPPFSVEVPDERSREKHTTGETPIRRDPVAEHGLLRVPNPEIATVYDVLTYAARQHGDREMMGWRKTLRTIHESKVVKKHVDGNIEEVEKKWTYYELAPYQYITYKEYSTKVHAIGSGLAKLGLNEGDCLHIFASTGPYWLALSHAVTTRRGIAVTSYDTLGEEGLRHSAGQTKVKMMFTEPELLSKVSPIMPDVPLLRIVIYNDLNVDETQQKNIDVFRDNHKNIKLMSVSEVQNLGQANMLESNPPTREDICCIMYTSGTTGMPKGVPIKHKAVVSAIAAASNTLGEHFGSEDRLLSYLPLAHIFEYVIEHAFMYWGMALGYGSPKTLTDTSVRNCKGDIREFKPTLLVGVPAVWELIKKGILAKLDAAGVIQRKLFWAAYNAKAALISSGLPGSGMSSSFIDSLVFSKIREATGGKLRLCLYGGAPISQETHRFISLVICPMLHGYGMTETCAMGTITRPRDFTWNSIGGIAPCVEMKLVDYAEAGYLASNNPPQGEVWVRGDPVLEEYFENEQETKEAITSDGWFKTGDIGEWDAAGHLRLIDRKKNLVKTLNGEYIALEKLETIYRSSKLVTNVCVYAAQEYAKPVAIVVPDWRGLKGIVDRIGSSAVDLEDAVQDKKVQKAALQELQSAGRAAGLASIEIIDGIILVDDEWTSQNEFLTAAQKIVRKKILAAYRKQVYDAYKS